MIKIFRPLQHIIRWLLLATAVFLLSVDVFGRQIALFGFGTLNLLVSLVVVYLLFEFIFLYADYRQHKKPLKAVDPEVEYSLIHHIKQVTYPTLRYRLSNAFH